jgi:hypothetical protein
MSRRIVLLLSVGLNAALLLACWQLWTSPKPLPSSLATLPARLARLPDPPSVVEPESPVTNNPVAPATVHWSELASTDLFTYRDNLRAVGCPEATVRVLRLALGDGGYDAYRRYAGAWLQALSEGP